MTMPRQCAADVPGQLKFVFDHEETHGGIILIRNAPASNSGATQIRGRK
jgi:hypothetical protein